MPDTEKLLMEKLATHLERWKWVDGKHQFVKPDESELTLEAALEYDHRTWQKIGRHEPSHDSECPSCRADKERQEAIERRKQLLLTELLGETVKVRHRAYQTMKIATVDAYEQSLFDERDGKEWMPRFRFKGESRGQRIEHIMRLDVKVDGEWQTVWDDGTDDLSSWEPLASSAKPTKKRYKGGLE
jgi:hypothetical protein